MRIWQDFNQFRKTAKHSASFRDLEVNGSYDQCLKGVRSLTNVLKFGTSFPQPLIAVSKILKF